MKDDDFSCVWWMGICNPSTWEANAGEYEVQARLSYIERPYLFLKKEKKKKQKDDFNYLIQTTESKTVIQSTNHYISAFFKTAVS